MNDVERSKFAQEKIKHRQEQEKPGALVEVVGHAEDVNIHTNEARGLNIFDGRGGDVKNLKIMDNKAYGGKNPIRLGDAFGVEIAGNFADVELPKELIDEAKSAKTEKQRLSVKEKLIGLIPDGSIWPPLFEIFAKCWGG